MPIVETDLIDGSEIPSKAGVATSAWTLPVYNPNGTEEGGLSVKQAVDLVMQSISNATVAAAITNFSVDKPVYVQSTKRWYQFVNSKSGVEDDGDDVIYVTSGGSLQAITPRPWRGAGAGLKEFKPNPNDQIDATPLHSSIIWTSSSTQWKSSMGVQTRPAGLNGSGGISDPSAPVDAEAGVPWTNDTAYPTGTADVATILGGYDHVNNQLAGTILGGGHHYLQYSLSGHGTIVGGSNHRNAGGYGAIVGGTQNTIGAGNYGAVLAGANNLVLGTYAVTIGGYKHRITAAGIQSVVVGGEENRIEEDRAVILGGQRNVVAHSHSVVMGADAKSEATGYLSIGTKALTFVGDSLAFHGNLSLRTVGSASGNMSSVNNVLPVVGNDYDASLAVEMMLIARDEATGDTSSFKIEAVGKWDGTTYELFKDGSGGTSEPSFDVLLDQIGVTVPKLAFNTGALRPRVYGKTGANVKWSAVVKGAIVRV